MYFLLLVTNDLIVLSRIALMCYVCVYVKVLKVFLLYYIDVSICVIFPSPLSIYLFLFNI